MKKTISLLLLILIFGLLSACQEDEERSFSIDQVKIDAQIQDDGTIQVRELYTYSFDGKYQGMTRSIYTNVKNFQAYETHETSPLADTADMEKLTVEEDEDDDQMMKIHTASEDETKSVLYSYEVHNAVDKYADVADLTYAFFDESNETDLNNVDIVVHLPEKASEKEFHTFLHSRVRGELIQTGEKVHYKTQKLTKGNTSEMRLIYPAEQMTGLDVTENVEKSDSILALERDLAKKGKNLNDKVDQIIPWILIVICAVMTIGIILLIINPNRYRGDRSTDQLLRLVESTDPLFVNYIDLNEHLNHESFVSGLLSLKQRGIITLEEVPFMHQDTDEADEESSTHDNDTTLRFNYVDEETDLDQADDYLINWLFTDKDDEGRYFLLESLIVQDNESTMVQEEKAEKFENHLRQWIDLVNERENYQNIRYGFDGYGIFSTLTVLASFGFLYYFTKIDLLTSAEQLVMGLFAAVFTLGVIFFNKNKWVITAYYLASFVISVFIFSETKGVLMLLGLQVVSWIILMIVPAKLWREDIKVLKKAINVAYQEFKKKRYPVGADANKVERRLEYAIVLGASEEYGETCQREEDAEAWDVPLTRSYPLLNNPLGVTMMFDPNYLILYSTRTSGGFGGSPSGTSGGGGGGAGAF